jgi:hypothetical protein
VASYAELAASGRALLGVESEFRAALADLRDAAVQCGGEARDAGPLARPVSRTLKRLNDTLDLLQRRLADLHTVGGTQHGQRRRTIDRASRSSGRCSPSEQGAQHGIELSVSGPSGRHLPRAELHRRTRRILLLLFDNALHALTARRASGADSGLGGRDADRLRLLGYGPAFRRNWPNVFLPGYTTRAGAVGMGLTIVLRSAASKGDVWCGAVRREGCTVRVEFAANRRGPPSQDVRCGHARQTNPKTGRGML